MSGMLRRNVFRDVLAGWIIFGFALGAQAGCRWDGTAPFCGGSCKPDERTLALFSDWPYGLSTVAEVLQAGSFGASCITGSKALCCTQAPGGQTCRIDGTAPFCEGSCHADEQEGEPPVMFKFPSVPLYPFAKGDEWGRPCLSGQKKYCCKTETIGRAVQPLVGTRNCAYGPNTCVSGLVWREASSTDYVCVKPEVRDQARDDNANGPSRRAAPGAFPWDDACKQGYVWREAFHGDRVCVTPETRVQVAIDNYWQNVFKACP